jgi:hypothetical protein
MIASIDLEYAAATTKHDRQALLAISRIKVGSNHLERRFDRPQP